MKKIILLLLLPVLVFAAVSPDHQTQLLLQDFKDASSTWRDSFMDAARYVFWSLTVIDLVLSFGTLVFTSNLDFGSVMTTLIQKSLIIGFFLMLFQYSHWLVSIPRSFNQLANNASGVPVEVDSVFNYGIDIVADIWKGISIFAPGDSLALVFAGIVLIIAFSMMAAQLFMTTIKMYAILAVAPLVFSLGGLSQTRQMAYNPIFAIIKVGMELLFLKLFMGLTITKMHEFSTNVDTDNNSILIMIGMAILMVSVVQMVHGLVEAVLSGTLGTNSTSGFGTAANVAGGAMGAARGAVGMGAAVKAASNLAKEQRAAGDSTASTMKNLRSAFGADVKRSFAGENYGGSMGGRMAFKHSNAESLDTQAKAQKAVNSGDTPQGTSDGFKRSNDDAGALAGKK